MIELDNKSFTIMGPKGSGKSWLLKSILDSTPQHLIYDPLNEHPGYRRYVPDDRGSIDELNEVIFERVIPWKPRLFVVDEANRYIRPKPTPLPQGIADLNDFNRHWGIATGFVCRRPSQFHTDIVELAAYNFFFALHGKNDYVYLEDIRRGLGDAVRALPEYHFIVFTAPSTITIHSPIDSPAFPALT